MRLPVRFLIVFETALLTFLITICFRTFIPQPVLSVSPHVVISEIQLRTEADTDDEFVELYNPSGTAIDVTGWKLTKKTESGATQNTLVASISGTIPAKGYFLLSSPESLASGAADQLYSTSSRLAANNTVTLYGEDGTTIIDVVGLGTATASETAGVANPVNGGSVERKAQQSSDSTSMGNGGSDEFAGNGFDSDNNSTDFIQRTVSRPQNSAAAIEPPAIPTPTETATPTVTPSETPTPTITTSVTPTPTSSPTETPSPIITPTVSPSPTMTPSETPIPTNTPTATPSSTPTQTPFPTPTSIIHHIVLPHATLTCTWNVRTIRVGRIRISIPQVRCVTERT